MQNWSEGFPVYVLMVKTGKTWRLLAIFPHKKSVIKHLVFRHVYCGFPERINAVFVGGF